MNIADQIASLAHYGFMIRLPVIIALAASAFWVGRFMARDNWHAALACLLCAAICYRVLMLLGHFG